MTTPPLHTPSLSLAIAERLRPRILRHEWTPGADVSDAAIAAEYGVSRTPVREALKLLSHEGLLTAHPRRGMTVAIPSAAALREALALHAVLLDFCLHHPAALHAGTTTAAAPEGAQRSSPPPLAPAAHSADRTEGAHTPSLAATLLRLTQQRLQLGGVPLPADELPAHASPAALTTAPDLAQPSRKIQSNQS